MYIYLRFFVFFFIFLCTFFAFFASADRRRRYIRYRDNIGYPRYGESYNIGDNQYSSNNLSYCPINRFLESVPTLTRAPPRDGLGVTYLPSTISSDAGYADLPLALLGAPVDIGALLKTRVTVSRGRTPGPRLVGPPSRDRTTCTLSA